MSREVSDPQIRDLVSRSQIEHVLMKYCRGVDRRLWDEVADCYHADAVDDHGTFVGEVPALMEWFKSRHQTVVTSIHCLGNIYAEVDDDTALVETYFYHLRVMPAVEVDQDQITHVCADASCGATNAVVHMWGRYLDRFENRALAGWRIAKRQVVGDDRTMFCPAATYPLAHGWPVGRRDADDLSVSFFAQEGLQ
ncbi:nuclear transport factor 2 family protein [Nocardioides houyundeii]|uniref:nuclear transport factor 2 family protein n=1 Tax=Nocardioides houyundeii TaxID=2045452 RepID=UPI000DF2630F|nr:nuclear transport factor 2 family protein [Nocardioides houyundeii]